MVARSSAARALADRFAVGPLHSVWRLISVGFTQYPANLSRSSQKEKASTTGILFHPRTPVLPNQSTRVAQTVTWDFSVLSSSLSSVRPGVRVPGQAVQELLLPGVSHDPRKCSPRQCARELPLWGARVCHRSAGRWEQTSGATGPGCCAGPPESGG